MFLVKVLCLYNCLGFAKHLIYYIRNVNSKILMIIFYKYFTRIRGKFKFYFVRYALSLFHTPNSQINTSTPSEKRQKLQPLKSDNPMNFGEHGKSVIHVHIKHYYWLIRASLSPKLHRYWGECTINFNCKKVLIECRYDRSNTNETEQSGRPI